MLRAYGTVGKHVATRLGGVASRRLEQALELILGREVAPEIMVHLADAVEVARAGDDQVQLGGHGPQGATVGRAVVLVIDLEAGEAGVAERREGREVDDTPTASPPGVRDHSHPSRGCHQPDHRPGRGRVADDVPGSAGVEPFAERLPAIGDELARHHDIGDMRTSDRG